MCGSPCAFRGRRVPCFHATCFDFRLSPITQTFLDATNYSFSPPFSDERRRADRIQCLLVPRLKKALGDKLPHEVLAMIAELLVRECATVTGQAQAWEQNASDYLVDLSRDVYARYHVVDGVRYVKSLGNFLSETNEEGQLLLDVQKQGGIRKIVIAEDHLGIRLVKFVSLDAVFPKNRHGLRAWWRDISKPTGISEIKVRTDVSGDPV